MPTTPDILQPNGRKSQQFDAIGLTTRLAVAAAALVILSAGVLGYTALYDLFVSIGLFAPWLGVFFPLLFDLAEIAAAVAVFNAKLQGEDDRFAWRMVLLFTVLGVIANIAHATFAWHVGKITPAQFALAIFATSLFPLSVALVTHLVKRVIARDITRRGLLFSLTDLAARIDQQRQALAELLSQNQSEIDQKSAELDRLNVQIDQASARLEQARSELKQVHFQRTAPPVEEMNAVRLALIEQRRGKVLALLGQGMSPPAIADELQVSLSTIKRDLSALNGAAHEARGLAQ